MTCALNGSSYTALVFQAVACDTAREQFALFVDELDQEVRVFVINVLDTEFAETAIFLRFRQASKIGGSAETEVTALTVSPNFPPGPFVVTMLTPLAKAAIASTKRSFVSEGNEGGMICIFMVLYMA